MKRRNSKNKSQTAQPSTSSSDSPTNPFLAFLAGPSSKSSIENKGEVGISKEAEKVKPDALFFAPESFDRQSENDPSATTNSKKRKLEEKDAVNTNSTKNELKTPTSTSALQPNTVVYNSTVEAFKSALPLPAEDDSDTTVPLPPKQLEVEVENEDDFALSEEELRKIDEQVNQALLVRNYND